MAEISDSGDSGKKGGKKRAKKQSTRIDMTPMVDLAFLLLTFFVLTATFSKPKSMELTFPDTSTPDPDPKPIKNGITLLLTKDDRIFYYEGEFKENDDPVKGPKTQLTELSFSQTGANSLKKYVLDKSKAMQDQIIALKKRFDAKQLVDTAYKRMVREVKADKNSFTYLIKTDDKATYRNVIDVVDELNYNAVGKYVVVDLIKPEYDLLIAKVGP